MSNTIQSRQYSVTHAMLLQQQPSALIDAVESIHRPLMHSLPTKFHGGRQGGANIAGNGGLGEIIGNAIANASRSIVLVDIDRATSSRETAVELGSYSASMWLRWTETTKAVLKQSAPDMKRAKLRVERLTKVQAVFGLPTLELAQVLGVTRQGFYKWLDASKDLKLQENSRDRLALVERIGKRWRDRSAAPLGSVAREPLPDGRIILDLLVAENIDEAGVVGAFDHLIAKLQAKPKSRSQKLADAGFKRRPSARSLPSDE